ncbi:MAG TPA: flagellar biosynthetic protein FliO [Oscillatoriaceae cyanobacterium]
MAALVMIAGLWFAAPAIAATPAPSPQVSPVASVAPSPQPTSWFATPVPTPTPAPLGGNPDIPILGYLVQLAVVTALVAGLGYISLKFTRGKLPMLGNLGLGGQKQIRILDRVAVDPKRLVFLVGVGKRYFLVAATENSATPIAELAQEDLGDFAQTLEQEKLRGETL